MQNMKDALDFEFMINNSPTAIILFNDNRIIYANSAVLELLGYGDFLSLSKQVHILKALQLSHGEKVCSLQSRNGKRHEYFIKITDTNDYQIAYLSRSHSDFANNFENNDNNDLSRSRFIAAMSHELNTPLNTLTNLYNILLNTNIDDKQREIIILAQNAADNLEHRIEDILDYSNIRAKPVTPDILPFNLKCNLNSILNKHSQEAKLKNLKFIFNIDERIDGEFLGNQSYFSRILNHICDNAVKYTPNGEVIVHAIYKSDSIEVTVSDSGNGIESNILNRVFDPFSFEKDPTTRLIGGINMGLSLSRRMARLLGGDLIIKDNFPHGTIVTISLPFTKAKTGTDEIIDDSLNILVAEDNPTNQRVINIILNQLGHRVVLANDGLDCINKLKCDNFDMIFMDLHMPIMDGWAAAQNIRTNNKDIPIIALSADTREEAKKLCDDVKMNGILHKPIMIDKLYNVLLNVQEHKNCQSNYGKS